jgi:hypothetical protein
MGVSPRASCCRSMATLTLAVVNTFRRKSPLCISFVDWRQRAAVIGDAIPHQTAGFGNKFSSQSGSSEQTALSVKLIGSRNAELLQPCHLTSFQCGGGDEGTGLCP